MPEISKEEIWEKWRSEAISFTESALAAMEEYASQFKALSSSSTGKGGVWQLCPRCNGEGIISPRVISTTVFETCDVCHGAKILASPETSSPISVGAKTEGMFTLEDLAKSHWRGWFVRERYTGPDRHGYEEKLPKNWVEMDYDEHEEWFFSQFVKETFGIDISNK